MKQIIILSILSAIFIWYDRFTRKRVGQLPSISASFKALNSYKKYYGTIFCFVILAIGLLVMFLDYNNPFSIVMLTGTVFTAGSPYFYKGGVNMTLHFIGTIILIVGGFGYIGIAFGLWWLMIPMVLGIALIYLIKMGNKLYWVEILGFILIILGMYYGFIKAIL